MKNDNYSSSLHASLFTLTHILHSTFFILHYITLASSQSIDGRRGYSYCENFRCEIFRKGMKLISTVKESERKTHW